MDRLRASTDAAAGLVFIILGGLFGLGASQLDLGTAFRMGPGYFPIILSGVLVIFGLVILVPALRSAGAPIGAIAWRGMPFILGAPLAFGLTVRGAGFVPAVFLAGLVAAFATPRMTAVRALLLAAAITAFATVVFSYGLGLPFRRLGPWLGA
jgi:hypothetical protein